MLDLAYEKHSAEQVKNALQSNREVRYEICLLDKKDYQIGIIDDVDGSYSFDSGAEIKGAGRFNISERKFKDIDFLNERIKPYFCLRVGNEWLRWGQGIYILSSPDRTEKQGGIYRDIEAYDKSVILREDKVDNRYLIRAGTLYTDAVRELILSSGIDTISIQESNLTLTVDKEYEIGTSKLEIINNLLLSINYNSIWFDGNGFCMVRKYLNPKDRQPEFEYVTDSKSIMMYGSTETLDAFNVPNKFIRYVENPDADYMISTFVNDKSNNKLSTVSRGRVITDIEAVSDIPDQATLDEYVKRVANEKSQVFGGVAFNTLTMPHHQCLDCYYVRINDLGVSEKVIETGWSISMSDNGLMSHKCKKVIELW
jgi:hypothetical protein